jgi:hypothetical protein
VIRLREAAHASGCSAPVSAPAAASTASPRMRTRRRVRCSPGTSMHW